VSKKEFTDLARGDWVRQISTNVYFVVAKNGEDGCVLFCMRDNFPHEVIATEFDAYEIFMKVVGGEDFMRAAEYRGIA
jgi:hypothetical protein